MNNQSDSRPVTFSSQLPELPPWSQLDPSALLALPELMRKQVLKAYEAQGSSKKQQVSVTPPRTPTRSHPPSTSGRKTTRSRKEANTPTTSRIKKTGSPSVNRTRTPEYKNSRFKSLFNHDEPLPFDEEVWNELPECKPTLFVRSTY
jgi:DNA repair protein REV1